MTALRESRFRLGAGLERVSHGKARGRYPCISRKSAREFVGCADPEMMCKVEFTNEFNLTIAQFAVFIIGVKFKRSNAFVCFYLPVNMSFSPGYNFTFSFAAEVKRYENIVER